MTIDGFGMGTEVSSKIIKHPISCWLGKARCGKGTKDTHRLTLTGLRIMECLKMYQKDMVFLLYL
jgi:hypothetical protein